MQRLRHTFVAGFFVIVPLVVSTVAIVWLFQWADGLTTVIEERLGVNLPPGTGILVTAAIVLAVGLVTTNVIGRRLVQRTEQILMYVPLFRTIYAPVKQLITAFSPDSETGFKRVVFITDPARGFTMGFLTKEFTVDHGEGADVLLAVYVPTNHLYLGDVVLCRPESVIYPRMTVEEGIRVFLTGGMALRGTLAIEPSEPRRAALTTDTTPGS
jgi:uncharacterized membrane protein